MRRCLEGLTLSSRLSPPPPPAHLATGRYQDSPPPLPTWLPDGTRTAPPPPAHLATGRYQDIRVCGQGSPRQLRLKGGGGAG